MASLAEIRAVSCVPRTENFPLLLVCFFLRLAKGEYDFKLSALSAESLILITQSQ